MGNAIQRFRKSPAVPAQLRKRRLLATIIEAIGRCGC